MNNERHRRLERLIDRHLPKDLAEAPEIQPFLAALNVAFEAMDQDRRMAEHVFAVSEREYQKVLLDLERENRLKREHVARMEVALRSFVEEVAAPMGHATTKTAER
jgi:hypothetical protein